MLKDLKKNSHGIVFVTVLVIIIVMMVLVISILGMNTTRVMVSEDEIRRIQAETLAMGMTSYAFANAIVGAFTPGTSTQRIDNTTYSITTGRGVASSGLYATTPLNVVVSYP